MLSQSGGTILFFCRIFYILRYEGASSQTSTTRSFYMKVTVLGSAGGIGQALSLLLKVHLPEGSELALHDIAPVNVGVGVDLSHISTAVKTLGYTGTDPKEALDGADLVLISAGVARKPGMTRDDLFAVNAGIIKSLAAHYVKYSPNAILGIITNPVNTVVPIAREVLKKAGVYQPTKLFGVSSLDFIRTQTFVSELKGISTEKIEIPIIGGHSGPTILPLLSQVPGVTFTDAEIEALTTRIQNAGTEVVEAKAGGGSATLSMGFAAAYFARNVILGLQGGSPEISAYVENPKAPTEFFAQKIRLGKEGVEEILPYGELSAYEQKMQDALIPQLKKDIQKGIDF